MHLLIAIFLLLLSRPVQARFHNLKRYDIDGNGIPDWCWTDGISAHCMESDGSWTVIPATEGKTSTTVAMSLMPTMKTALPTTVTITVTTTLKTTTSPLLVNPSGSGSSTTGRTKSTLTPNTPSISPSASAKLPTPSQFRSDKGKKWSISYQGNLTFSGSLRSKDVRVDKGRTGMIGDKIIWNFGDMQCAEDWRVCGFSMGSAFYGMPDDVMTVNTTSVDSLQNTEFVQAWSGDAPPRAPHWAWGMDSSNVAAINDTHGVVFAWEIWRGASDGSSIDRGNAVALITLDHDRPIAQRVGPLLTGPASIQLGLVAILRDKGYIYTYSIGGPTNLIVGRSPADDCVFNTSQHTFLALNSTVNSPIWLSGIPEPSTTHVGATTANPSQSFGCDVYGSVFYNSYLRQYLLICSIYTTFVNMYTSPTPWGPWSSEYELMNGHEDPRIAGSYGTMVHEMYGAGKEIFLSLGPNGPLYVYRLDLGGY